MFSPPFSSLRLLVAKALIHEGGIEKYFWSVVFQAPTGTTLSQPPPAHLDQSLFSGGGVDFYLNGGQGGAAEVLGNFTNLSGQASPVPAAP
jgi:hypothetical protein